MQLSTREILFAHLPFAGNPPNRNHTRFAVRELPFSQLTRAKEKKNRTPLRPELCNWLSRGSTICKSSKRRSYAVVPLITQSECLVRAYLLIQVADVSHAPASFCLPVLPRIPLVAIAGSLPSHGR